MGFCLLLGILGRFMLPFWIKVKRNYSDTANRHITIVLVDIHLSAAVEVSHPGPNTGRTV